MAQNTERLLVSVEADTSKLKSSLAESDIVIGKFASRVDDSLYKVDKGFTRLNGTLISAGIGYATSQIVHGAFLAMEALADLSDQAERLGIAVETLQELGLAALENGSSIERMNDSLEVFTKNLGQAQAGSGKLLETLTQYGVAVKNADGSNRSNIEVLHDLADVLASVSDSTLRAKIATEAFGRAGAELIPLLAQGSDAIRNMGQEAQAAGLILDEDLVARAAEFDNAWKVATYKVGIHFKSYLINSLDAVIERMNIIKNFAYEQFGNAPSGPSFSKVDLGNFPQKKSDFETATSGGSIDGLGSFSGVIQRRMENLGAVANPFEDFNKKSEKSTKATADKQVKAYKDVIDNLRFEIEQLDRSSVEQEVYNNLKAAGVDISTQEGQKIADLTRAYREHADQLSETARAGEEMGNTITQSLNNAILGADSLGDSLRGLINSIANSVLSKYVTGPAGDFFGEALGSLFAFENGGIMTSRGSVPLRAYAGGGVASSPQLALYGEGRTPEAYVPLPDGRTIPVTMSGNVGGGSVVQVTQNLNISTGVEQTTRAEIARMMPQIRQAAVSAVNDATQRGKLRF